MTTIAWDGKTLAVDGQVSYGDTIMEDRAKKLWRNEGIFSALAVSGSYDPAIDYIHQVLSKIKDPRDLLEEEGRPAFTVIGIVKETGEAWQLNGDSTFLVNVPWAFGSGADSAIAVLDFGGTAVEAVKYAATRDVNTNSN